MTTIKTILCVDDDKDDLLMLREAINNSGTTYHIIEAFDGQHALELLHQMQYAGTLPCLIILDINMPRMDGKQTLVALQKDPVLAAIPVVLFSTSSSLIDQRFSNARNVRLFVKPFDQQSLLEIAARILNHCTI